MTTLLVVLWFALLIALVVVIAVRPVKSRHSLFELGRLGRDDELRRERLLPTVSTLQSAVAGLLIVPLAIITATVWGWWTLAITPALVIIIALLARLRMVQRATRRLYRSIEPHILSVAEAKIVTLWLGHVQPGHDQKLESSDQLIHLIDTAGHVLTDNQKSIIRHGIDWHETAIGSVMAPRKRIETVKYTELIGPLVLNDLHGTGHKKFPVIKDTVDNIIGMLDITALVEVSARSQSQTAEKLMSSRVLRVSEDESLPQALELLQKSHEHLLVVVDQDGKTVGLVTLTDITRSLLGAGDN